MADNEPHQGVASVSDQLLFVRGEERATGRHNRARSWILTIALVATLTLSSIALGSINTVIVNMQKNSARAAAQRLQQLQVAQCTQQQLGQALHYRATVTTLPPKVCLPVR